MDTIFSEEIENYVITGDEKILESLLPTTIQHRFFEALKSLRIEISKKPEELPNSTYEQIKKLERENSQIASTLNLIAWKYDINSEKASKTRKAEIIKKYFGGPNPVNNKAPIFSRQKNEIFEEKTNYPSEVKESDFKVLEVMTSIDNGDLTAIEKITPKLFPLYYDLNRFSDDTLLMLLSVNGRETFNLFTIDFSRQSTEFIRRVASTMVMLLEGLKAEDELANQFNLDISTMIITMTTRQLEVLYSALGDNSSIINKDPITQRLLDNTYYSRLQKAHAHSSKEERRKILFEMREFLKDKSLKFESMKLDILIDILQNGIELNNYDFSIFIEYLKNPLYVNKSIQKVKSKEWEEKCFSSQNNRRGIQGIRQQQSSDSDRIINAYLTYFFHFETRKLEDFTEHINLEFIEKLYYRCLLLRGEENPNYLEKLGKSEYTALSQSSTIKICEFNKSTFSVNETVKLIVDLKNIQTLFVQIFEINTENYYLKTKQPINSAISLEGLVSTHNQTHCFSESAFKQVRREFVFDKIPSKRGIYVIELIGGGLSSRAMIQKGSLTAINKNTSNGLVYYILNENTEICADTERKTTGIWIRDTFYPVSNDQGAVLVPYFNSSASENAVLVHNNFAELTSITLFTENYSLSGNFILNHESLIMGSIAKVLFKPELRVNNTPMNVGLIKKGCVTLTLTKVENNQSIPIINKFENIEFSESKDVVVEFQVPPKLTNIRIEVIGEVENKSQSKSTRLIVSNSYDVNSNGNENNYSNIFMSFMQDGYYLTVLGKNGETKSNIETALEFNHYLLVEPVRLTAVTNEKGIIKLGALNQVYRVSAKYFYLGQAVSEEFIVDHRTVCQVPKNIEIPENFEFEIPFSRGQFDSREYSLFKYSMTGEILEDVLLDASKCRFIKNTAKVLGDSSKENTIKSKDYGVLRISNLSEGQYSLIWNFMDYAPLSSINVVKGEFCYNNVFLKTPESILELSQNLKPVSLNNIQVNLKSNTIRLEVANHSESTRIHVFAYKYLPRLQTVNTFGILSANESIKLQGKRVFNYSYWRNFYLSDRLLHEEIKYVLDRKDLERFTGNTLDKPSLLMKRQFIRDTRTEVQDAREGTEYDKMEARKCAEERCFMEKMEKCKKGGKYGAMHGSVSSSLNASIDIISCINSVYRQCLNSVFSRQNYLPLTPLVLENLVPNDHGVLELQISDLDYFSTIQIIAMDKESVCDELVNVYQEKDSKNINQQLIRANKDLALKNILDPQKPFCENRKLDTMQETGKFEIKDITSTSFKIIDSIENYLSYIALTNNSLYNSFSEKFSVLLQFDSLDQTERLKFVSENFSHELNVFLFFKFPEFFNAFVKPVIKMKSEKTLVDFALLNRLQELKSFLNPSCLDKLNPLEQCLLVFFLRDSNYEECFAIANSMKNKFGKYSETENFKANQKRYLSIIMNMKMSSETSEPKKEADVARARIIEAPALEKCARRMVCKEKEMEQRCLKKKWKKQEELFEEDFDEGVVRGLNLRNNLFKDSGSSKEYRETHYCDSQSVFFSVASELWVDLAEYFINNNDLKSTHVNSSTKYNRSYLAKGFISKGILIPVANISELVFSLAFLDLPKNSIPHEYTRLENLGVQITAKSNLVLFIKDISESSFNLKQNLMMTFLVTRKNKAKDSKKVESTFITHEIYLMETIVTNISPKTLNFELLIQIPQGAIPVDKSEYTATVNMTLNNFETKKLDTFFYFPQTGKYLHHPPSANIDGKIISQPEAKVFSVESSFPVQSSAEFTSLDDVLESGSKSEILDFIRNLKTITNEDIDKVLWLLSDKDFCINLYNELNKRGLYNYYVWSNSIRNFTLEEAVFSEGFEFIKSIKGESIEGFYSRLLVAPEECHLDYHPIINSRVHGLSNDKKVRIRNKELKQTYKAFIMRLFSDISKPNAYSLLRLSYYLILQDRVEEAILVFNRVDIKQFSDLHSWQIQYDYIHAYLDFSCGETDFKVAKELCAKYRGFPIVFWRDLFEEIEDQLLEYEGKIDFNGAEALLEKLNKDKASNTGKITALEESKVSLSIEGQTLNLVYYNCASVVIKYYLIDIETLFSITPFMKQEGEKFSYVKASKVSEVPLVKALKEQTISVTIPEELVHCNLFVEVNDQGKKMYETYFSTSLVVTVSELFGELKVCSKDLKASPKVYVKCYAKLKDNSVKFFKDGYTDLRGKFNYISINTDLLKSVSKFSLLIIHDKFGSIIKEVNPPSDIQNLGGDVIPLNLQSNPIFAKSTYENLRNDCDIMRNYQQQAKKAFKSTKYEK